MRTFRDELDNWMAHWHDPSACDALVLDGPQTVALLAHLDTLEALAHRLAVENARWRRGDGSGEAAELIACARSAWETMGRPVTVDAAIDAQVDVWLRIEARKEIYNA